MRPDLLLFPCERDGAPALSWARVGARGGKVKTGIAQAGGKPPPTADAERTILLVPGEDVAVCEVALPARSDAQAQVAAGFAVEDLIAQPLDDVHVVAGPAAAADKGRAIAVVDRGRFASWRVLLDQMRTSADLIAPDYMALPAESGGATVVDLGDRVLVRAGGAGFAAEPEIAREALGGFLADAGCTSAQIWSDRADELLPAPARASLAVQHEPAPGNEELARLFARGLETRPAVELSRADVPVDAVFVLVWRRWRAAVALAAAAAVGYVALTGIQIASFERARAANYVEAEQLLADAFPDIGRIVNPRVQLRAQLGAAGGDGAAFTALSGLVADSVRGVESLQVDSVRFEAGRAELSVGVRYATYEDIERLRAAISARGGVMEEGGSRQAGETMISDIVVRAAS
ncbi:MAG: type II secretion system protein GspL [Maricaulaceae bacterium]|jgi:general secretion pathway protein L